jgi:hypothetical protein
MIGPIVTRIVSKNMDEEPQETIIIRRCKMADLDNTTDDTEITDDELAQIIKDMEDTPDDQMEYLGDEEIDDEDVPEDEMIDDDGTEDEYL